jgi:hypothetical protein
MMEPLCFSGTPRLIRIVLPLRNSLALGGSLTGSGASSSPRGGASGEPLCARQRAGTYFFCLLVYLFFFASFVLLFVRH